MSIIGSTAKADFSPRFFKIDVPAIDCFFSGTGDMFAGLVVVRLREAISQAGLGAAKSWMSPDDVQGIDLPLANAAEKVLGSMHAVLVHTKKARDQELEGLSGPLGAIEKEKDSEKILGLRRSKAAEVRVVRCLGDLREPKVEYKATAIEANIEKQQQEGRLRDKGAPEMEKTDLVPDGAMNERAGLGMQHQARRSLEERSKDKAQ